MALEMGTEILDRIQIYINRPGHKEKSEVRRKMRGKRRAILILSALLLFCAACSPKTEVAVPSVSPSPSATPEPAVAVEDVALLSGLSLVDGEEPRVLAAGENVALVAVDERYPESSPYYLDGGNSSFTKAVYAISCADGQVLRTLAFDDGLSYCQAGAVNAQGMALQLLRHEPEGLRYEVLLFPEGESGSVVAESGRWDGVSTPRVVLLTGGGLAYTWGSQMETGECAYGLRVRGMDGALVQEISLAGDTLEALNTSLAADGEQFLFTMPQTAYLGDSQQNRVVFEAEPEGSIYGGVLLGGKALLNYQPEADGPKKLALFSAEGEALTEWDTAGQFDSPISSGGKIICRGKKSFLTLSPSESAVNWTDTGMATAYVDCYSLGNGQFLLWDRNQKSARVLTLAERSENIPQEGELLWDNGEVSYFADFDDGFVIDGYDTDHIAYHGYLYLAGARFLGEEFSLGEGDARWNNEERTALDFGWRNYYPLEEDAARELGLVGVPEVNWSFQIDLENETVIDRSREASADDLSDEELVEIGKKLAQILSDADEFRERQRTDGLEEPSL